MKTHQEKLNELTEAIRKSIPRLMELSEGCVIKPHKQNEFILDATFEVRKSKGWFYIRSLISVLENYYSDEITIIGHEPLLNDVLEWLDTNKCDFSIRKEGFVFYRMDDLCMANWDLSKSKLSDQSEELIDFLHDLIKLT